MTDQQLEQSLRNWYRAEIGDTERAPAALRASVAAIPPTGSTVGRRTTWRFPTLDLPTRFAVAVVAVVTVAIAAGLVLKLAPVVTVGPSNSPSETTPASPAASDVTTEPTAGPAAVFVFTKGAGTSAECGNDGRGGCIPRMWVAKLDGTGARELLPYQSGCQRALAWSPDGTRLLYSRSDCKWTSEGWFGAERFYLTDASGSEPQLVDTGCVDLCVSENDAVFSADGLRILFVRTKSIPPPPLATDPVTGKPAQGTEVRVLASIDIATDRVTELGDFDECPGGCGSGPPRSDPIWSPDRTQILYTWAPWTYGPHPPAGAAVLVADADGRNVLQLSASGGTPAWSLDGTRIAFRSERYSWKGTWKPGVVLHAFFDIYTVRPDGSDLVRLTSDGVSLNPEWSSDGRIWFIRVPNLLTPDELPAQSWVMDVDGGNAARLADKPMFQAWQVQPTP